VRPRVLVVDDDDGVRFTLGEILSGLDVDVVESADGEAAWAELEAERPHLILTDLRMPRLDGLGLLRRMRERGVGVTTVVLTAHGSEAHAVEAMKLGAFDYLKKPFEVDAITDVVRRATQAARLDLENAQLRAELVLARHLVFRSAAMRQVAVRVERVAPRDVTVLIVGQSGTGKERIAEALVAASPRASGPLIRVNCAAFADGLVESELFGHARGAFTGATRDHRLGSWRPRAAARWSSTRSASCHPPIQAKLLRVIQSREVRPLGVDTERGFVVDVRLVCATHRDLEQEVAAGRFREDLYYRLRVVRIDVPPLADRPEDIPALVDHFVQQYTTRFGLTEATLSAAARAELSTRVWRGNVRELENTIEEWVALSDGVTIGPVDAAAPPLDLRARVEAYERGLVVEALRAARGNRSEAARKLGIGRVTLLDKLKKYRLSVDDEA
jgi:two-component system response regulator HydG